MTTKRTILLIDDDFDLLEQLRMLLESAGYEVVAAESQREAEDQLLSVKPDLVIVDLMMEQKDSGLVLCHHAKEMHPNLPIIMLTAVKSATGLSFAPASAEEESWVKADKVLDKPVNPDQLIAQIKRLLDEPREARHAAGH
ncbi:MAG: response regulator transcription factor [Planctomycetota bacterium]